MDRHLFRRARFVCIDAPCQAAHSGLKRVLIVTKDAAAATTAHATAKRWRVPVDHARGNAWLNVRWWDATAPKAAAPPPPLDEVFGPGSRKGGGKEGPGGPDRDQGPAGPAPPGGGGGGGDGAAGAGGGDGAAPAA